MQTAEVPGYQLIPRAPPGFIPWGWGGSQREAFCLVKLLTLFPGQAWPDIPCRLSGLTPASQTEARWVSRLCIDRLSVVD